VSTVSQRKYESSKEEVLQLIEQFQKTNDKELETKLILMYESLVYSLARKFSRGQRCDEDLFQVGQMSLLRLFKQFDNALGVPFEAYAVKSIIGHLKNYLRDKSWYIQVPRLIKEKGLLVQRAVDELTVTLERSPRMDEIAEFLDLSLEETIEALSSREFYSYTPLDAPLTSNEESTTIGDLIGNPHDDYKDSEKRLDLQDVLVHLKEEERTVLHLAYTEGYPQREIAERLGTSQMGVSRIQKRAIEKLKKLLAEQQESP